MVIGGVERVFDSAATGHSGISVSVSGIISQFDSEVLTGVLLVGLLEGSADILSEREERNVAEKHLDGNGAVGDGLSKRAGGLDGERGSLNRRIRRDGHASDLKSIGRGAFPRVRVNRRGNIPQSVQICWEAARASNRASIEE
jgi:hypothetical protein